MSEKLSQKQIKQDIREDSVSVFIHTAAEKVYEHRKTLAGAGVGVLLLVVALAAFSAFAASRNAAATNQLAEAMKIVEAPVGDDEEPDGGSEMLFESEEARRAKAKEKLEALRGKAAAGEVAELYLADIAIQEGDTETARNLWQSFVDKNGDHLLAQAARLNLISLDRQEGRGEALIETLTAELASSKPNLSHDVLLFELARTFESLGQEEEAKAHYQRLLDEHASSPYIADARAKAGPQTTAVSPPV